MIMISNVLAAQVRQELLDSINTIYWEASQSLKIDYYNQTNTKFHQFNIPAGTTQLSSLKIKEKEIQQKQYRTDIGLVFKATANHNVNNVFDDENNEFVSTRIRTELEWNIFKNGFFNNRQRAEQLNNDIAVLEQQQEVDNIYLWRRQYRLSYSYAINNELIELLESRQNFLNGYFELITELYRKKIIDREHIINLSNDIQTTQQELNHYKTLNGTIKDSIFPEYAHIKLPFVVMVNDSFNPEIEDSISDSLELSTVQNDYKWYQDISLSIYANQNWVTSNQLNRNYTSVGLRLKIPLKRNYNKELLQTREAILKYEQADKDIGAYNSTLTYYNSYREKFKDLKEQYKKWELLEEQKRKLQLLKEDINDTQAGIKLMQALTEQFEIVKNMLQIKRQLYTSLSHLYQLDSKLQLVKYTFKQPTDVIVLVSNSTIYTNTHQIAFLKLQQIEHVYIKNIDKDFKEQLILSGFEVIETKETSNKTLLEDWMLNEHNQLKTILK